MCNFTPLVFLATGVVLRFDSHISTINCNLVPEKGIDSTHRQDSGFERFLDDLIKNPSKLEAVLRWARSTHLTLDRSDLPLLKKLLVKTLGTLAEKKQDAPTREQDLRNTRNLALLLVKFAGASGSDVFVEVIESSLTRLISIDKQLCDGLIVALARLDQTGKKILALTKHKNESIRARALQACVVQFARPEVRDYVVGLLREDNSQLPVDIRNALQEVDQVIKLNSLFDAQASEEENMKFCFEHVIPWMYSEGLLRNIVPGPCEALALWAYDVATRLVEAKGDRLFSSIRDLMKAGTPVEEKYACVFLWQFGAQLTDGETFALKKLGIPTTIKLASR